MSLWFKHISHYIAQDFATPFSPVYLTESHLHAYQQFTKDLQRETLAGLQDLL